MTAPVSSSHLTPENIFALIEQGGIENKLREIRKKVGLLDWTVHPGSLTEEQQAHFFEARKNLVAITCSEEIFDERKDAFILLRRLFELDPLKRQTAQGLEATIEQLSSYLTRVDLFTTAEQKELVATYASSIECLISHRLLGNIEKPSSSLKEAFLKAPDALKRLYREEDRKLDLEICYAIEGMSYFANEEKMKETLSKIHSLNVPLGLSEGFLSSNFHAKVEEGFFSEPATWGEAVFVIRRLGREVVYSSPQQSLVEAVEHLAEYIFKLVEHRTLYAEKTYPWPVFVSAAYAYHNIFLSFPKKTNNDEIFNAIFNDDREKRGISRLLLLAKEKPFVEKGDYKVESGIVQVMIKLAERSLTGIPYLIRGQVFLRVAQSLQVPKVKEELRSFLEVRSWILEVKKAWEQEKNKLLEDCRSELSKLKEKELSFNNDSKSQENSEEWEGLQSKRKEVDKALAELEKSNFDLIMSQRNQSTKDGKPSDAFYIKMVPKDENDQLAQFERRAGRSSPLEDKKLATTMQREFHRELQEAVALLEEAPVAELDEAIDTDPIGESMWDDDLAQFRRKPTKLIPVQTDPENLHSSPGKTPLKLPDTFTATTMQRELHEAVAVLEEALDIDPIEEFMWDDDLAQFRRMPTKLIPVQTDPENLHSSPGKTPFKLPDTFIGDDEKAAITHLHFDEKSRRELEKKGLALLKKYHGDEKEFSSWGVHWTARVRHKQPLIDNERWKKIEEKIFKQAEETVPKNWTPPTFKLFNRKRSDKVRQVAFDKAPWYIKSELRESNQSSQTVFKGPRDMELWAATVPDSGHHSGQYPNLLSGYESPGPSTPTPLDSLSCPNPLYKDVVPREAVV